MKKKFSRILGVALTLAMVASLFVFAVPAAAQVGDQTWAAQTIPGATGNVILDLTDVADIAVASDGTIYVINNEVAASAANSVFKSTNGGQSFTALTAIAGGGGLLYLRAVAVAPDDSSVVMVTDGLNCFLSTDSGTTWTTLGTSCVATTLDAAAEIQDVDVSPAIPGALFGRHYVRCSANVTANPMLAVGAELIGVQQSDWTALLVANAPAGDYMAVKFSPSYIGDRALAVVYNTGAATFFDIISQPQAAGEGSTQSCNMALGVTIDYESEQPGGQPAAQALVAADIALPSDWDPTLTSGQVSYVGIATSGNPSGAGAVAEKGGVLALLTGGTNSDVYRIDASVATDLAGSNTIPVHSIAYSGTIDDGTLFLGQRLEAVVRYSLNPTSMAPTWKTTDKQPTGDNVPLPEACTVVRIAPNGDIYAGTRDSWWDAGGARRSAFSVSTDAGLSFNQTAIIDVGAGNVVNNDDVMLTPDGGTIFLSTRDAADLSLWKSTTPTGSASWERVYCRALATSGIIRLAPDWADAPSVFWADIGAAAGVVGLYASHDGGATFANRTVPAATIDLAVESGGAAGVLYIGDVLGNVYESTNGGYWFSLAIPSEVAAVLSLSMAPMYPALPEAGHLIVGGTNEVSYSTDGATTFTLIDVGLGAAGNCVVGADEAYATNNTIYAAGGTTVYRFVIGTSADWTDLTAGATVLQGLGVSNGVLYAADTGTFVTDEGVHRTVGPLWDAGTMAFEVMDGGAGAAATFTLVPNCLRVVNNVLYAIDTTAAGGVNVQLLAYDDFLATATVVLSAPADGSTVLVDPVTGRAIDVGFSWQRLGSGTGLVNDFEIQIAEAGTNFGAPLIRSYSGVASLALGGTNTLGLDSTNPVIIVGATGQWVLALRANQSYEWRIRARDTVAFDTIRGQWSESRTINIQAGGMVQEPQVGPQLQGPLPGATGVSVNPGFSWSPIAGATEYEFILALDAGLTLTVEDTPVYVAQPSWQVPEGTLEYDTTYFWGVKATQPTESVQSIGTFHTLVIEEYVCPFCGETFTTAGALDSHIAVVHPAGTPAYMWAIIVIGAVLMIAVIMLIMKTRRVT